MKLFPFDFKETCKQYLWKRLLGRMMSIEFTALERWWGNNPVERSQAEIDIMGEQDKIRLFSANVNGQMKS